MGCILTEMSSPLLGVPWGTKWTQDMLKGCANCEYESIVVDKSYNYVIGGVLVACWRFVTKERVMRSSMTVFGRCCSRTSTSETGFCPPILCGDT